MTLARSTRGTFLALAWDRSEGRILASRLFLPAALGKPPFGAERRSDSGGQHQPGLGPGAGPRFSWLFLVRMKET